jgi:hypothetical protein
MQWGGMTGVCYTTWCGYELSGSQPVRETTPTCTLVSRRFQQRLLLPQLRGFLRCCSGTERQQRVGPCREAEEVPCEGLGCLCVRDPWSRLGGPLSFARCQAQQRLLRIPLRTFCLTFVALVTIATTGNTSSSRLGQHKSRSRSVVFVPHTACLRHEGGRHHVCPSTTCMCPPFVPHACLGVCEGRPLAGLHTRVVEPLGARRSVLDQPFEGGAPLMAWV